MVARGLQALTDCMKKSKCIYLSYVNIVKDLYDAQPINVDA